jgi:hypothetical protein
MKLLVTKALDMFEIGIDHVCCTNSLPSLHCYDSASKLTSSTLHSSNLKKHCRIELISFILRRIGTFPDWYCCNCLGERWWEGRPRSHFCKPIVSVCHVTLLRSHIVITRVLFRLRVSLCLQWVAKLSNTYASSFAWSSVNPLPKPSKCFLRLLRIFFDRLCGLVVEFLATDPEARVRFPALPKKKVVGLERSSLSLVSTTEELLDRKVAAPV